MATALGFVAAVYAGVAAIMWAFQDRLLFLPNVPSRAVSATPADAGMAFEALRLPTADGETLAAWWIPYEGAALTLVHFHGNAGNIGDRVVLARLFQELRVNVVLFDYRGYGESSGRASEDGTYADARAIWRYLTQERSLAPRSIVLHGQSLGGAIAAELASAVTPAALILESTFTSVPELAGELYPWLPARQLARIRYDTRSRLTAIACPVLVAHSRDDEIIPYTHGERLYAAAREPKRLLTLAGDHNGGVFGNPEAYVAALREFLGGLRAQ